MRDQAGIAVERPQQFSIGAVLQLSGSVLTRHAIRLAAPTILGVIVIAALWYINLAFMPLTRRPVGIVLINTAIEWIGLIICNAATVYSAAQALQRDRIQLIASFERALSTLVPIILTSIIVLFATALGLIFLIAPGIFLAATFWVYMPAIVVERKGINASLNRSMALSRGRMWQIVALTILLPAFELGLSLLSHLMITPLLHGFFSLMPLFVMTAVFQIINATVITASYFLLRAEKEGASLTDVARVFD